MYLLLSLFKLRYYIKVHVDPVWLMTTTCTNFKKINKLTSVFYASVLLSKINCIIHVTLSKWLWNHEPQGKCAITWLVVSRFFSMYFTITGHENCLVNVWRLVKLRFHFTDYIPSQAELIENWVSLPISTAKLKTENSKQFDNQTLTGLMQKKFVHVPCLVKN